MASCTTRIFLKEYAYFVYFKRHIYSFEAKGLLQKYHLKVKKTSQKNFIIENTFLRAQACPKVNA